MIIMLCISMSGADSKLSRKAKIPAGSTPWNSGELRGRSLTPMLASLNVREGPAEGVQDHVEPELELVSEVVPGFQNVLGRHLDEVRVRVGGELLQYRLGNVDHRVRALEWQGCLLERESIDVAVERAYAWAVISTEKPAARSVPMVASWWRSVSGPGDF